MKFNFTWPPVRSRWLFGCAILAFLTTVVVRIWRGCWLWWSFTSWAGALLLLAALSWFLKDRWWQQLKVQILFPGLITLVIIGITIILWEWPRNPDYQLQVVADNLTFSMPCGATFRLDSGCPKTVAVAGTGLKLTASDVRIDQKRTHEEGLSDKPSTLTIEPIPNPSPRPEYNLNIEEATRFTIEFEAIKANASPLLDFQWDRDRSTEPLHITPSSIATAKVDKVVDKVDKFSFSLEVRNCTVRFDGFEKRVNDEPMTIFAAIRPGVPNPFVIELPESWSKDHIFDISFRGAATPLATFFPSKEGLTNPKAATRLATFFPPEGLTNPKQKKVHSGILDITDDHKINFGDSLRPRSVDITGTLNDPEIHLNPDGLSLNAHGRANTIKIDDRDEISSGFSLLLRSNLLLAVLAFLAWSLDKYLAIHGALQSPRAPSTAWPSGTP